LWPETRGAQKAALDLWGRPMIAWVVDALRAARSIDRVVVAGLEERSMVPAGVETVPDQGSLVGNLYAGMTRLSSDRPAAYCWSDIPLASPAMFDRYIEATSDLELDVNAGLVPKEVLQQAYPGAEDLWLRLAEGRFIAADFGVFHPRHAARLRPHLEALAPQRKSAWRQALYVGLPLLLRYATGRLSMTGLEGHVERRFGLRCKVRVVSDPELGLDVDSPGHLALCRTTLGVRSGTSHGHIAPAGRK
jgi:hypothetical protein